MKYCRLICITVLLLVGSFPLFSQDSFITLSGKIVDAQTREGIPFANLQVRGKSIGTSSNAVGEFIFKIPERLLPDTLLVSSIGYNVLKIAVARGGFEQVTLALNPAAIVLREVIVNPEAGFDILKRALAKIPENYDTSAVQLTAFYRENLWLGDYELAFNESVLDIYKTFHYDKIFNDQIRIVKGRKKKLDHSRDAQFYYWISNISNGARSSLANDLIKYQLAKRNPLNPKNFRYYTCEYNELIRENNRNVIVLDITPKEKARRGLHHTKLFIDEESLAIIKMDVEVGPNGIDYANRHEKGGLAYTIMSKVIKARLDFSRIHLVVTYRQHNGKWHLNTVHRRIEALLNSKKRNMTDRLWAGDMDLMITDIKTDSVKSFQDGNVGGSSSSMNELVGNDTDEAFWENYNYMKSVLPDSLKSKMMMEPMEQEEPAEKAQPQKPSSASNRQNGFTRADTLRGKLSPLRSCYDVTFYHLDVKVDMDQHTLKGNNTLRFKVTEPFQRMQVDLYANMKIEKILYKECALNFTREYDAVFIDLPETLKTGNTAEIRIWYEGAPKVPDWSIPMNGGVLWDQDEQGNPWAQMVCQGSGASLWWPNKDHLSDEPDSMKIWITVPSAFTEISNGRLIRKTQLPGAQTRYEWFVSYPINNYNVTFNIGKYTHYRDLYVTDDTLTIDYYVMPYNLERSKSMFGQVKPMLDCFEKYFGKYPFPRDGFTLVESIYPMEHQSGVCIGKITQQNSGDTNPLLWHESAHEWWGNAISCKDLADMWIHEAFATYAEALNIECQFGKEAASDFLNGQRASIKNHEPVIGVYDVNHIYYDINDMYTKGSLILHTFRQVLNNDTVWFNLLRDIQQHFRYQTLTSDDLVTFINQRTHKDYTYFFDQYLKHTRFPILETEMKEKDNSLIVKYRWNADVTNFTMPVKMITPAKPAFLYPGPEWKTIILRDTDASTFEVDEDNFLMEVDLVEKE